MTHSRISDKMLWSAIANDRGNALDNFYSNHRDEFINWAVQKLGCSREDAEDIYQEAILIFYSNIKTEKLKELTASLKSYLYGIAKRLILKHRTKNGKLLLSETEVMNCLSKETDRTFLDKIDNDHQSFVLNTAIEKLNPKEQRLIRHFYYNGFCMEAVKNALGYKNENVVRGKKFKAVKKLQAQITRKKVA